MRYTCCASLRQGFLFQVSLAVSSGAFLSAIVLTQYLPYSRAYVCISTPLQSGLGFLGHRSIRRYLVGTYSLHRPSARTHLWLLRSDPLFSETLRVLCYPPDTIADGHELKGCLTHFGACSWTTPLRYRYHFGQAYYPALACLLYRWVSHTFVY